MAHPSNGSWKTLERAYTRKLLSSCICIQHSRVAGESWYIIPLAIRVRGPYRKLPTEFFPLRFMDQARSARAINHRGKNELCAWAINRRGKKRVSVTYSIYREDKVSSIFIISLLCVWRVRERFPFMRNMQLQISEPGRKQNKSIWDRF